jgi:hypothetical protein
MQMSKYTGVKCAVCGKVFTDDDDVVVCPECGVPYHRECWQIENKCLYEARHGEVAENADRSGENDGEQTHEPIRCARCGAQNDDDRMFCVQCGMPLTNSGEERPFNEIPNSNNAQFGGANRQFNGQPNGFGMPVQQIKLTEDSDLDGIRLGDFYDYTGRKSLSLIANFVKFAKTGTKISINVVALFFPEFYFFYRKMKKEGIFFLIMSFILSIPTLIYYGQEGTIGTVLFTTSLNLKSSSFAAITNLCSVLSTLLSILAGFFANFMYYKQARKDIGEIRAACDDETAARVKIKERGGTSWLGVLVCFTLSMMLTLAFWLIMSAVF